MRPARRRQPKSLWVPALLAGATAVLLVANLGVVPRSRFLLPVLGILVGAFLAATAGPRLPRFVAGVSLLGCFALLLLSRLGYLPDLRTLWPAFLVVVAAAVALARWRGRG